MVDINRYNEELNKLVLRLSMIEDIKKIDDIMELTRDICKVVGISYIDITTSNSSAENFQRDDFLFPREDINEDNTVVLSWVVDVKTQASVTYTFYSKKDINWDATEKTFVQTIGSLIFNTSNKVHVQKTLDKYYFVDMATGVRNMNYFVKRTYDIINKTNTIGDYTFVIFNLIRFSYVNKKYGRTNGTLIMRDYVQGLQNMVGDKGDVFRIYSDNFIVMIKNTELSKVLKYLAGAPVFVMGPDHNSITVRAIAGVYKCDGSEKNSDDIVDYLHATLNIGRNITHEPVTYFEEKMRIALDTAHEIEEIFPDALRNSEFVVYYQPKVQAGTHKVIGAEALCRWVKDGQVIAPGQFIPILENSSYICELDFYMLDKVCKDIRTWLNQGYNPVTVSVNLSRVHVGNDTLKTDIMQIIDRYDIPHKYIEIELTETTTDVDFTDLKDIVGYLREHKIKVSVDDFGMGYSSLNLVRDVPWDLLKIDKTFLPQQNDENYENKVRMLRNLIHLAQNIGLEVLVEGAETLDQVEMLERCGCDLIQGYYFDHPLEKNIFESKLEKFQ